LNQIRSKINKTEKELLEAKENRYNVCMEMYKERALFKNEEEERKVSCLFITYVYEF
jgi:hypothetical protein